MREKQTNEISRGTTEYRVHVQGKFFGNSESMIHTYKASNRPESRDEAEKIAGDFETIEKLVVEEVTTITKSRILKME